MAPPKKPCPECTEEFYAFQIPGHLFREHGIGEAPRTGGGKKKKAAAPQKPTDEDFQIAANATAAGLDPTLGEGADSDPTPIPSGSEEVAPRKPKFMDRLRSRRGRGHAGGQKAPASREQIPKRPAKYRGKRVSLDSDISDIWAFGGRRLENTPHFATGRMLQYQAPAAGLIVDRAVAGTLPDRLFFQPLARNRDKYEDVAFLLAGPLLTFSITTTQHQMQSAREAGDQEAFENLVGKLQMQQEMFVWVARAMLPRLAEGVEKARERERKEAQTIAQAFPDLGTEDPVQAFISMMFTPPNFEEASQNGRADHAAAASGPEGSVPFGG